MAWEIGAFELASTGSTITLSPDTLVLTESPLQIDRSLNLSNDSLVISNGSLGITYDSVVSLNADALILTDGFLSVSTAGNTTITPQAQALTITGGNLSLTYNVIDIVDVYQIMLEVQATLDSCCGS